MGIGLEMHKIFDEYFSQLSHKCKKVIRGYEPLDESIEIPKEANRKTAIKVMFRNRTWIRVYRIKNEVEWY